MDGAEGGFGEFLCDFRIGEQGPAAARNVPVMQGFLHTVPQMTDFSLLRHLVSAQETLLDYSFNGSFLSI